LNPPSSEAVSGGEERVFWDPFVRPVGDDPVGRITFVPP
jgi:hypothetical protein